MRVQERVFPIGCKEKSAPALLVAKDPSSDELRSDVASAPTSGHIAAMGRWRRDYTAFAMPNAGKYNRWAYRRCGGGSWVAVSVLYPHIGQVNPHLSLDLAVYRGRFCSDSHTQLIQKLVG